MARPEHLIVTLNPVIRGWAKHHRHVVSKGRLRVDDAIFTASWQWADGDTGSTRDNGRRQRL